MDIAADLYGLLDVELEEMVELISELPETAVLNLLNATRPLSNTATPKGPLEMAQELDAGYRSRPHLTYLSERLAQAVTDVENGKSRFIRICMPPRMGKSLLSSVYLPAWLLRKHPEWKVGLVSHSPTLSVSWARAVRRMVEEFGPDWDVGIARDAGAVSDWETTKGGEVHSRSAPGQSLTGMGFNVMLLDDLVKDSASAHSKVQRDTLWEWWLSNALSRLEPPSLVVAIGCLTAESPVLMADGSTRPIRYVRPGDEVVTYYEGRASVSIVRNWANMGSDDVYTITMESGRVVRANARHPFLTVENGVEKWTRTDSLAPGSVIRATGADGGALSARPTTATNRSPRRGSARPTTTRSAGLTATAGALARAIGRLISSTATALTRATTRTSSKLNPGLAPSADALSVKPTPSDAACCSSITVTTPTESGACCATTATSSSATVPPSLSLSVPSSIFDPTTDVVTSVEITGHENVYDIEVEGTHTFVVNGLVTHNTRWHEDDLLGRLLSTEYDGDPGEWEVIEFPALAEDHDVLGRSPGEPLYSPLLDETPEQACERWEKLKAAVGSYSWSALYQQHPSPAKGAIFDTNSWRYWTHNPNHATDDGVVVYIPPGLLESGRWLDSWDMSFKGTETSDWVVAQRWCRQGPNRYLVHQEKGRWSFTQALGKMEEWITPASPYGTLVHQRLVEDTANGPAIMDVMKKKVAGIKAISPKTSKEARARAVTPECESGHVYLPFPGDPGNEWVLGLISELRNFPLDANDDQVDAFTQALGELRDAGMGLITVPGQGAALGIRQLPTPRGPYAQNVKRPAAASMRQRIRRA